MAESGNSAAASVVCASNDPLYRNRRLFLHLDKLGHQSELHQMFRMKRPRRVAAEWIGTTSRR